MLFKSLWGILTMLIISVIFTKSEEDVARSKRGVGLGIAGLGLGGLGAAGIAGIGVAGAGIAGAGLLGVGLAGAGIAKAGVAGAGIGLGLGLAASRGNDNHYDNEEVHHIYIQSHDYHEPKSNHDDYYY